MPKRNLLKDTYLTEEVPKVMDTVKKMRDSVLMTETEYAKWTDFLSKEKDQPKHLANKFDNLPIQESDIDHPTVQHPKKALKFLSPVLRASIT